MRNKWLKTMLLIMTVIGLTFSFGQESYAASSYTNAKEFYNTANPNEAYRVETYDASIYYASRGKLASNPNNLKYRTLGYDIRLEAGGASVSFAVKRGASLTEVNQVFDSTYEYILYKISTEKLQQLATVVDSASAKIIFAQPKIMVYMDAIQTTLQYGKVHGSINEDGKGGITYSGTIYRMKNAADTNRLKSIFRGHTFETDYMIEEMLINYKLNIYYGANGGSVGSSYTLKPFSTFENVIHKSNSPYIESKKVLEKVNLTDTGTFRLQKEGYHLDKGKEWISNRNVVYDETATYTAKEIHPNVGIKDVNVVMLANWQVNKYTINYHANGGAGSVTSTSASYGEDVTLRNNTFTKQGYMLVPGQEWNTRPDGTGTSYSSEQIVKNLVLEHGGAIDLYANWIANKYTIQTDKAEGTGGDDKFYEKYNDSFYIEEGKPITKIEVPTKTGHEFDGYYMGSEGAGDQVVDAVGNIKVPNTYFKTDSFIVANWLRSSYTITFDKQGGTKGIGTDSAKVYYGDYFPFATAPVRPGYTFYGYYEKQNGQGTEYYSASMSTSQKYLFVEDKTIYAYWIDDKNPVTEITGSDTWTNTAGGVNVTGRAYDYGSGLSNVKIYCNDELMIEKKDLNGVKEIEIPGLHKQEGVYRYKIVAVDMVGNTHESYANVKYDITAPKGVNGTKGTGPYWTYTLENDSFDTANLQNFSIKVLATDYNTK